LDQRNLRPKEDLEAIAASNDILALGAMEALQSRSIRVPEDVAVVGFNDSAEARSASPSVTSVAVPFQEQGMKAVHALKGMMEGESVPGETIIPSRFVIHQSCGCLDATVAQAGAFSPGVGQAISLEEAFVTRRETIVREMVQAMDIPEGPAWAETVLDGFILDLGESQSGEFLTALREVLRRVSLADRASLAWQNVLSVLQRHAASCLNSQRALLLIGQARAMLGETISRALAQLQLEAESRVQTLQAISSALIATFDVKRLVDVLAEGLPTLGIPSCYLAVYEDSQPYAYPEPAPEWSRLILAYNEDGRVALGPGGERFLTGRILPEGMLPAHRRYTMVLQPLYFQDDQIGFVLFEVGPQDWSVYEVLRGEIASALYGARLTEQTARRAVQLQTAAEVSRTATSVLDLDTLLQQVVELVQQRFDLYYVGLFLVSSETDGTWAKLRAASGEAGRQMLDQGHRLKVGGESMIGQCVTDHQSRIALDVGKEAVRFNNPLLPETHSEMALPLITREGAVGALSIQSKERRAFGDTDLAVFETLAGQLANAIANARTYEQVAQAYDEIQLLNERLKDENLRMTAELEVTQRLQQMLLPTVEELEQIEELDIAGFMEPADEVGGDYYDVLNHNGQIKIGIGDVTGHGLESGVVMLMLQTAVRTLMTSDEKDPVRFLSILNQLLQENTQRMQVSKSMTLALLDYEIGQMRVSGQHEQVIVVRKGGQVELKDTLDLGFPLGLMSGVADFVQEMAIDLQSGDGVVLYSDGITEAENEAGEFYGLEQLCQVVGAHWKGTAEAVSNSVIADVKAFIGDQKVYDDITLVVVKQR
jgi:serine phosphatase RsbU (regulator of sigma subunit)/putative methionine-R-sulfoxide reductase with GAF domain